MAIGVLPLSGEITLTAVNVELSRPLESPIDLNDDDVRILSQKLYGTISMADLYGKSATTYKQQGFKLRAYDAVGLPQMGRSVAVSGDGNTLAFSGPSDNQSIGAVWVYTRIGETWNQQGTKLVPNDYIRSTYGPNIGSSISLSTDGNTLAVAAQANNNSEGATWIFTKSGSAWTQQGARIVGTGAIGAIGSGQGFSVRLSGDGNTFAVGGIQDNNKNGAVWVFVKSGNTWIQQAKLVGTGNSGPARQGASVALSYDGNTLAFGGTSDDPGGFEGDTGAAWVFTRSGSSWTQQGPKLSGEGAGVSAFQGSSVDLSDDGNTLAVGGDGDASGRGAVWIYVRSGDVWYQQGPKIEGFRPEGLDGCGMGHSVALSADGNTLFAGGYHDNFNIGATWAFKRSANVWTQNSAKFIGAEYTGKPQQGWSIAASSDAKTVVVGGSEDENQLGSVWVFIDDTQN